MREPVSTGRARVGRAGRRAAGGSARTGGVTLDWPGRAEALALADSRATETPSAEHDAITPNADLLIEGDNLDALKLLEPTHAGAFKIVYIDPPYNTGSALSYHDRMVRGKEPDHAAWLAMMLPRLVLARRLMRDDGVIFVSIDDGELAYLTLAGHQVFGESNFLGAFVHQRAKGGGQARSFIRGHDYVLVWARNAALAGPFLGPKKPPAKYEVINGRRYLVDDDVLRVSFGKYTAGTERRLMYEDVEAVRGSRKKAQVDAWLAEGSHVLRPWGPVAADGVQRHAVVKLTPAEEASSKLYSIIKALGEHGRNALAALGLGGTFAYPKPVELVKALVLSQTFHDRDALVLDFFAGSGTTAQAVLELNAEDGGNRRYVLVQRPEPLRAAAGARTSATDTRVPAAGEESATVGAASPAGTDTPIATISELMRERVRRAGGEFRDVRLG